LLSQLEDAKQQLTGDALNQHGTQDGNSEYLIDNKDEDIQEPSYS
jgi:hypothetical protein